MATEPGDGKRKMPLPSPRADFMKKCAAVKYTRREAFVTKQLCLESSRCLSANGSALVTESTSFVSRICGQADTQGLGRTTPSPQDNGMSQTGSASTQALSAVRCSQPAIQVGVTPAAQQRSLSEISKGASGVAQGAPGPGAWQTGELQRHSWHPRTIAV